jgi:GAF domain-containing protein/HAMP domain-containing protein
VGATALAISGIVLEQLNDKVEQQLTSVSKLTSTAIGKELTNQISIIQAVALSESLQSTLARYDPQSNIVELQRLDEQWRAADAANNDTDPLVRKVLENDLSDQLRVLRADFPAHVEIFITDVYGANIATTNRTTDYFQADEEWWQSAYSNGEGAIFISQPVYDESSDTFSIQIALPIFDNHSGVMLGIIRSTLDLNILIPSLELGKLGETGRTEIYMPGNLELELHVEDGQPMLETETSPADFTSTLAEQPRAVFLDTIHDGSPVMAGITIFTGSGAENPEITEAFERLQWRVVALQDRTEALQTVADTARTAQLIGLAALVLASLVAVGVTQFITKPILQLTETAEEVSTGNLNAVARVESPDEVGGLAESFNRMTAQLRDTLSNLERRIEERTYDIEISRRQTEQRAAQYLAIGEISKLINSEQELSILLPLITRLVSERFGFYHTGIFLIDDTEKYAVLQAANSPGGQIMLKRGHRLKVGESGIVGSVGKTGAARVALDVGQDAVFFNNPDLPETRSEAALPLKVRDSIIGVLDVQSERPGAFTENDVNILAILADQIAIAIENTRLFEQTQQALVEARLAYQRTLHEGWRSLIEEEGMIGYQQSMGGGRKLTQPVATDEINQAMNRREALVFHADGKTEDPTLVVPIKLREQIIGVMHIKAPSRERQWTADEINLAEAVSDRLSLALENARLLQEFQRQAIKEQTITEITGRIGSSINLNNVLLTAVEELGRTIPGSEVTIKLKDENRNNGNG